MSKRSKQHVPISRAKLKYTRVSPYKLRKVANEIRGKLVNSSLSFLKVFPNKSASILYDLLKSAKANAVSNSDVNADDLVITTLLVNQGPVMKRIQPRARGRAFRIIKPTSHVYIELSNKGAAE